MSDQLPEFDRSGDASAVDKAKQLISWLPDPKQCDCGSYTDATRGFVESQAMVMRIWECPECGKRYYRDRK